MPCFGDHSSVLLPESSTPVSGGGEILSKEGTTQGDPLGMAMFTLSMVPLMRKLKEKCESAMQVWFADDASGGGTLVRLKRWWSCLVEWVHVLDIIQTLQKHALLLKKRKRRKLNMSFKIRTSL